MLDALVWAHGVSTAFMTGVIWFVQLVHYPGFARVPPGAFRDYHAGHMAGTSWVVGPAMLVEAATAIALVPALSGPVRGTAIVGLILLGVVWASTALIQVPCHRRLSAGPDPATVSRLVGTNWIRTAGWSLRTVAAVSIGVAVS